VDVLNDLVRSYMSPDASVVPQFLKTSFDMLRDGQARVLENMNTINPMAKMPGFEVMQAQQEAFMKAMTGNMPTPWNGMGKTDQRPASAKGDDAESLDAIKQQLAELQEKLSKLK
ncbi:MAG TPA: polyhydroxyalkanoate synthesis repressor PhaR, partial [Sulfitobacter sp.]|jgi:polyhydroxyalkanoate synthesis regulator protein|nr:polyhydroxyalkanoate synthesis repressor PhaR [Sulfitobacter sp.]